MGWVGWILPWIARKDHEDVHFAKTVTQQKNMAISIVLWPFWRDTLTYATLRRIGKSWTQECLGKFWQVQRLVFPVDLPRLGEAANLWSLKKKQFWRMEAKNIKALQVLLKCDFWTSKKSWKPPLTFMEEWYLGQIYPTVGKKTFSNKCSATKFLDLHLWKDGP